MFDLILKCGHLFDGTGAEPLVADIAVTGDRISAIGETDTEPNAEVIDVTDLILLRPRVLAGHPGLTRAPRPPV